MNKLTLGFMMANDGHIFAFSLLAGTKLLRYTNESGFQGIHHAREFVKTIGASRYIRSNKGKFKLANLSQVPTV